MTWLQYIARMLGLRSASWPFGHVLLEMFIDEGGNTRYFEAKYQQEDPWLYRTAEVRHFLLDALDMIDSARGQNRLGRVIEIGCGKGTFTEDLCSRCESLLAVDISPSAIAAARRRRDWDSPTEFRTWNLRTDPMPGVFDAIVVMGVLEYLVWPRMCRAACAKLIDAIGPGGYLLVGDFRDRIAERAWTSRWLLFGGRPIVEFLCAQSGLDVVQRKSTESYELAMLRRAVVN